MLTIRMNEAAASTLRPLASVGLPPAVPSLSQGLRDKFTRGLTYNEGAWIFTEHVGQWVGAPASASAAIATGGHSLLTRDLPRHANSGEVRL
ncbi:hypothetical protein AB0C27_18920 [Nonomuraea sp. NPDC048882]|uniref:hypothetical protein n=1 Tax=Nonomuraea sp. NPDC048882 TaxID=3154347 RepID=UPI0033F2A7EC